MLTNENAESLDSEIPWTSPGEATFKTNKAKQPEPPKEKITKAKSLELLGLKEPFTITTLDKAFNTKKVACEKGKQEALNEAVKQAYIVALQEVVTAYQILIPFAKEEKAAPPPPKQTPPPKPEKPLKSHPKTIKVIIKKNPIVYLISVILIVVIALFIWKPWEEKIGPKIKERFIALKSKADLLATQNNWEDALKNYNEAYKLIAIPELLDSITSITNRLASIADTQETENWGTAKKTNSIDSYNIYLNTYTEGIYLIQANDAIETIRNIQEASRFKLLNKKKQIKGLIDLEGYTYDYMGEVKNNKPHGKGTAIFEKGHKYIGDFVDGNMTGQGTMIYRSGWKYVGGWVDDLRSGQGTFTFAGGKYTSGGEYIGNWKEDKYNGKGTFTNEDGDIYVGGVDRW